MRTDAAAVGRARQALDELEATWRGRVDRMSDLLVCASQAALRHRFRLARTAVAAAGPPVSIA